MNRHRARATASAEQLVERPAVLLRVAQRAGERLLKAGGRLGKHGVSDLSILVRLARAWGRGDYRVMPRKSLLALVGALVYFLMPLDAIPDPILGLGFLDDLAVLGYAMRYARKDLEAFETWEADNGKAESGSDDVS